MLWKNLLQKEDHQGYVINNSCTVAFSDVMGYCLCPHNTILLCIFRVQQKPLEHYLTYIITYDAIKFVVPDFLKYGLVQYIRGDAQCVYIDCRYSSCMLEYTCLCFR